jgi:hypothetical protein
VSITVELPVLGPERTARIIKSKLTRAVCRAFHCRDLCRSKTSAERRGMVNCGVTQSEFLCWAQAARYSHAVSEKLIVRFIDNVASCRAGKPADPYALGQELIDEWIEPIDMVMVPPIEPPNFCPHRSSRGDCGDDCYCLVSPAGRRGQRRARAHVSGGLAAAARSDSRAPELSSNLEHLLESSVYVSPKALLEPGVHDGAWLPLWCRP